MGSATKKAGYFPEIKLETCWIMVAEPNYSQSYIHWNESTLDDFKVDYYDV